MTKKQKEYRKKYNIINSADVCEIAHKETVRYIGIELRNKWHKQMDKVKGSVVPVWGYFRDQSERLVDCKTKKCKKHGNDEIHYTDKAQRIFNNYYDNICEQAGI